MPRNTQPAKPVLVRPHGDALWYVDDGVYKMSIDNGWARFVAMTDHNVKWSCNPAYAKEWFRKVKGKA